MIENQRVFIWAALGLLLYVNYFTWQHDYAPPPSLPKATPTGSTKAPESQIAQALPDLPQQAKSGTSTVTTTTPISEPAVSTENAPLVHVTTDVLDLDISTIGGEIRRADLLKYQVKNPPDIFDKFMALLGRKPKDPVGLPGRLLETNDPTPFVANSGLRGPGQEPRPTHTTLLSADKLNYKLSVHDRSLVVPLRWTDEHGVNVIKSYTFKPGSYTIDITYEVDNASPNPWPAASYMQLQRHYEQVSRSMFNIETYSYRGPEIYDGKGVRKLNILDSEDRSYNKELSGGWIAALQHHFVVAAIPPADKAYDYQLKVDSNNNFVLSCAGPLLSIAPGSKATFKETFYVGPKLQEQLAAAGHKLELTADYGRLTIIAQPLFWLLKTVHTLVGNWGVSIILTTFLIKLAFYHLTQTSGRSMAKMRNLAPRIKAVQERYKDNREQVGRAMMELYKREKINPLAGCLPILVQIPVFLSFYWVLVESVELRQAPFFGWVMDLSSRDPFFVLPLLMGCAMFAQFKLNPSPSMDPTQAKIFAFMPIVMTSTMALFPSGLVLYWLTNTLLSIAQQWRINKVVANEKPA